MTITEKYIQKILPSLAGDGEVVTKRMNGKTSYMFPCPFCSHLLTSSGKCKSKKQTAILMPREECNYVYTFHCRRGYSPECKGSKSNGRGFLNFLLMYKPYLAEKYKFEMQHC